MTARFVAEYSIQLSYECILLRRIIARLISIPTTFSNKFNNLQKKPDYNVLSK